MALLVRARRTIQAAGGPCARALRHSCARSSRFFSLHRHTGDAIPHEQGSSLIEFGTTLGLLMTFVYVLIQICMVLYTYGMISECAREASRYASLHGSTCLTSSSASCEATAAQINTYATSRGYPNIGGGTLSPSTTYSPSGSEAPGSTVQVKITYSYSVNFPLVPKKTISLQVSSEMYILQ